MTINTTLPDLFPGFDRRHIAIGDLSYFARVGGSGPPLLLLHGYPQTHVCWHRIAPDLAKNFTLIMPDLRGYGASSTPPDSQPGADGMSKRAIASDMIHLMKSLGYDTFNICGHDRGARVAYRLTLDWPGHVTHLAILDILPTAEVWRNFSAEAALHAYHWTFLAQPAPLPETLIAANPQHYFDHTLVSWTRDKSLSAFSPEALEHYRHAFTGPQRIAAACDDYRAGATIDRMHDEADLAAGQRITCPVLVLWGSSYMGRGTATPVEVWRRWADHVRGCEIDAGHFLAEENPGATVQALIPFLLGHKE